MTKLNTCTNKYTTSLNSTVIDGLQFFVNHDMTPHDLARRFLKHNRFKKFPIADNLAKLGVNYQCFIRGKRYDMAYLFGRVLLKRVDFLPSEISVNTFNKYIITECVNNTNTDHFLGLAAFFLEHSHEFRCRYNMEFYEPILLGSFAVSLQCISYLQTYFETLSPENRIQIINNINFLNDIGDNTFYPHEAVGEDEWEWYYKRMNYEDTQKLQTLKEMIK